MRQGLPNLWSTQTQVAFLCVSCALATAKRKRNFPSLSHYGQSKLHLCDCDGGSSCTNSRAPNQQGGESCWAALGLL